jgi:hypothetical protein
MFASRPNRRAARPTPEALESRQLLAASLSGVDVFGNHWVLRLTGPGDLGVTQQPSTADPNGVPLGSPGLIDTITLTGTDPLHSRLYGKVTQAATGASGNFGRVFFAHMEMQGGLSHQFAGANLGIKLIDMPGFYLGQTSTSTTATQPDITLPQGVMTLRFGGADTTFTPPGGTPLNQNNTSDTFVVNLGIPFSFGTSIVVDTITTDAQAATTSTGSPTQDSVEFLVDGRLNTFQANTIKGNTTIPSSGFIGGGGTIVQVNSDTPRSLVGPIGFVEVGGNATNFSVQTVDKISNFYIGGDTSNVQLLAPTGSRNIEFGKGMNGVTIRTDSIDTLQANAGAIGSNVTSGSRIGRVTIGGDVTDTNIMAGYEQNLSAVFTNQTAPTTVNARSTAAINNVLIAGSITNSIFAAAVQPSNGAIDSDQALFFPHSFIHAKVEGTISNDTATPSQPNQAFYAKSVAVTHGPVNPPNVPEPPFPNGGAPPFGHRVGAGLQAVTPGTFLATAKGHTIAVRRYPNAPTPKTTTQTARTLQTIAQANSKKST